MVTPDENKNRKVHYIEAERLRSQNELRGYYQDEGGVLGDAPAKFNEDPKEKRMFTRGDVYDRALKYRDRGGLKLPVNEIYDRFKRWVVRHNSFID
nr:hypothetical protein 26 [Candidatus Omnitrophota bacterium]